MRSKIRDIIEWVKTSTLEKIFERTRAMREKRFDDRIETCMIVNAKCGRCVNDCRFCSQSGYYNTDIHAFPLLSAESLRESYRLAEAAEAMHWGIVTSGQTISPAELQSLCDFIADAERSGSTHICASLGQIGRDSLLRLKDAGLKRYHHNLETSQRFYPSICTTQRWEDRVRTVRTAVEIGLETCSGGLFGLGESWEDRAELAMTLGELKVTSVPINFFDAHPAVPLAGREPLSANEALRIVALMRLILPDTSLRICGGRPRILGDWQSRIFDAGADSLMTGHYLTTNGVTPESDRRMIQSQNCTFAEHPEQRLYRHR